MDTGINQRRLRAGIVGGGRGAFIGSVHRIAAELDGQALLIAGAMSSDPATARASASAWFLERSYDSFAAMARAESARADGIDFVIIATPNNLHYAVARAFLEAGIHVICDKPLAFNVAEGEALAALVDHAQQPEQAPRAIEASQAARRRPLFALTHTYAGYPAVRQARDMIRRGLIGDIRKVLVEYNQDWLMEPLEHSGSKQAEWRLDPVRAGVSCCVGDIGSHAEHLLEFVTGKRIASLCADLTSFVPGRQLDDDANILLRLDGGGKGTLVCSQVACGEENNLALRVYGSKAGLEWHQQEPNTLTYKPAGAPWQTLRVGQGYMSDAAKAASRTPGGHPEGYLEAFAVIYRDFIADIRRVENGSQALGGYPTASDGLRGLRFIAKSVESSRLGSKWVTL